MWMGLRYCWIGGFKTHGGLYSLDLDVALESDRCCMANGKVILKVKNAPICYKRMGIKDIRLKGRMIRRQYYVGSFTMINI